MPEVIYVLDACALIAFLDKEEGWDKVRDLLTQAALSTKTKVFMSAVNFIEVYYDRLRLPDSGKAGKFLQFAFASPVIVINDISWTEIDEASRLKSLYPMSLADAIGVALAKSRGAFFVSSDHGELDAVDEREDVPFFWLRPKPESSAGTGTVGSPPAKPAKK